MILLMPMAGGGSRFKEIGLDTPKPLIKLENRYFFEHSIASLAKIASINEIIFIVLKEHQVNFNISKEIKSKYPDSKIVILEKLLNGPVHSVMAALEYIKDTNANIIINDCDHYFESSSLNQTIIDNLDGNYLGGIVTFTSTEPHFSYIKRDGNGKVLDIVEKKVISNEAICGAYLFKNLCILNQSLNLALEKKSNEEAFLSDVMKSLLTIGKIKTFPADIHVSFGTPQEFRACQNLKDPRWLAHLNT